MTRVPLRTCVGCRRRDGKGELLRIVVADDGVRADRSGSAPGRGAYVHRDPTCVETALRRGALARALRTGLDEQRAATLRADIERELQDQGWSPDASAPRKERER